MHITIIGVIILGFDLAGIALLTDYKIVDKLRRAGAVSIDTAVTPRAADLSLQEIGWLQYLVYDTSKIKKTRNGRYYI